MATGDLANRLPLSTIRDVDASVWLATALLTYETAQRLDPEEGPYGEETFAFRQVDIQEVAAELCTKTVHNARISQWTNADHPDNRENYLREVGRTRRLSRPDEFDDAVPHNVVDLDEPVLEREGAPLTYGDLVQWVFQVYPQLVPSRDTPSPREAGDGQAEITRSGATETPPAGTARERSTYPDGILLRHDGDEIAFYRAHLRFDSGPRSDVFAEMTTKTAQEMLAIDRYHSARDAVEHLAADQLDRPVGPLLADLKADGDAAYERFLNANGDLTYRDFSIEAPDRLDEKGLYVFLVDGEIKYIGKTTSSFGQRFNRNYGRIHPRNCYLDGQSTNCRLNHLVAEHAADVAVYLYALSDNGQIGRLEDALIAEHQPEWNVQGAS